MFCDGDMKWPLSFKEKHVVLGGGHSVGPPQPLISMGYFYCCVWGQGGYSMLTPYLTLSTGTLLFLRRLQEGCAPRVP